MREMVESLHIVSQVIANLRLNANYRKVDKRPDLFTDFRDDLSGYLGTVSTSSIKPMKKSSQLS